MNWNEFFKPDFAKLAVFIVLEIIFIFIGMLFLPNIPPVGASPGAWELVPAWLMSPFFLMVAPDITILMIGISNVIVMLLLSFAIVYVGNNIMGKSTLEKI